MVEFGQGVSPSVGMWQALRQDPRHTPEIAVLHTLPQLAPNVERWWTKKSREASLTPQDRIARRVLRRSTGVARRGGLITGSSFYVGMVPAMAMIYCEQLVVVLRIAAVYGKDPTEPIRAAEILVVQGRYSSIHDAVVALEDAGKHAVHRQVVAEGQTVLDVLRQMPSMIGLRIRKFGKRSLVDLVVVGAEVASYLVPVVSLPVWAIGSARAMRRLGRAAIDFYSRDQAAPDPHDHVVLPPRPKARTRRLVIGSVVPLAITLGVVFSLLPIGHYRPGVRWIGLALGEVALVLTFARLVRLTRVVPGQEAKPKNIPRRRRAF